MKISKTCLEKIKEFEGFRSESYRCPAGIWTIGYGHTQGVKPGQHISEMKAEALLENDLLPCETYVSNLPLEFTQGQFDALADFCFNLGTGALDRSTLLKKIRINTCDPAIKTEFMRWVHAAGKVLPGLQKRRMWDAQHYFAEV